MAKIPKQAETPNELLSNYLKFWLWEKETTCTNELHCELLNDFETYKISLKSYHQPHELSLSFKYFQSNTTIKMIKIPIKNF